VPGVGYPVRFSARIGRREREKNRAAVGGMAWTSGAPSTHLAPIASTQPGVIRPVASPGPLAFFLVPSSSCRPRRRRFRRGKRKQRPPAPRRATGEQPRRENWSKRWGICPADPGKFCSESPPRPRSAATGLSRRRHAVASAWEFWLCSGWEVSRSPPAPNSFRRRWDDTG
jgi:hypothetical protein